MISKDLLTKWLHEIGDIVGEKEVILDDPIRIKSTPHLEVFSAHGVTSREKSVYLMDGGGKWHGPLLPTQVNAEYVIPSIHQRLKGMK